MSGQMKESSKHIALRARVSAFIRRNGLCKAGDKVLLACSGGPDSTAMMDLMHALSDRLEIELGVLYIDHRQSSESRHACAQVKARCRRWHLPFFEESLDEKTPSGSSEASLREARYRIFNRVTRQFGYGRLATAHTRSDQVETILMRIFRGTGVEGLTGIPARREKMFIRPLLECDRQEIIDYLRARRLHWFDDPTNNSRAYLRNRIRHDLLPQIKRIANPSVERAILRLSKAASRDCDLLGKMAATFCSSSLESRLPALPVDVLTNLHDAVLSRVVLDMLKESAGIGANLELDQLERIITMLRTSERSDDWSLDLPGNLLCRVQEGLFSFQPLQPTTTRMFKTKLTGPGQVILLPTGSRIELRFQTSWNPSEASPCAAFFDGDQVDFPLIVRSASPGDRIDVWGGGTKKVSQVMQDAKIPRHMRPGIPLLVCGSSVLWVAGLRRSVTAPVKRGSTKILAAKLLQLCDDLTAFDKTELQ